MSASRKRLRQTEKRLREKSSSDLSNYPHLVARWPLGKSMQCGHSPACVLGRRDGSRNVSASAARASRTECSDSARLLPISVVCSTSYSRNKHYYRSSFAYQALAILSLYTQPTCAEEDDLPAQLGGRAIHHIQTLGLHQLKYDAPNSDDLNTMFCAVWALDRINAAVYGRPCLIHERDIGANLNACIQKQQPCFRLMLSVVQWLDQVIELYRPGPSAQVSGLQKVAYIDLPVLEAMIVEADALKVPSSLIGKSFVFQFNGCIADEGLATIESFYHAVIILSCRLPRPGTAPAASTLPPPSANARRSLAAERIAYAVPRDHLSPIPLVPYAVSLALSVEYRKMRHSRLPMFRARAMNAFRRNGELLRKFGDYFWSAKVVAALGERVLKEMERAATSLTKDISPPPDSSRAIIAADSGGPDESEPPTNGPVIQNATADTSNMVDFSLIDAISGQDVFGHIDPNFDLNAVEDALEANLDIGLPLNWSDWNQFVSIEHDPTPP